MSLVCSYFGFGDMAAFMKNGKMERLDGKHCNTLVVQNQQRFDSVAAACDGEV